MKQTRLTIPLALLAGLFAQAQRPPSLSSPDVHADNTVTFRYYSRTAGKVSLSGEFLSTPQPMTRDTAGVWSVTVGPIKPDIYPYSFRVDSTLVADPNNTYIFANERFKRSLVDIPGNQPLIHSLQNVPHGKVSYRLYTSTTLGTTRNLLVYTPPGFQAGGKKKYPVLYLIHGGSDTEETWVRVGRANMIIDNLVAQNKAVPMIIVMPYANVFPAQRDAFTRDMMQDIIPFIESNYPVLTDSRSRAIAGFSVGGGQTLNIGLMHTDKFAWVCAYAPFTATDEFRNNFTNWNPDAAQVRDRLQLFSISVGTEDFLYESVKQNIALFKSKKVEPETFIVPGGHTWMNCKLYLANTLQRLFKTASNK
jgi:enterochelin esterase-like enzyme